ncbi:unnamed protein product [Sphenostylis stenocarpa]|uniref:Uncharacterized protein n=1 Tax=Sphenostylis stenocarpa TaxID=92480 RepID=A0AA86SCZ3_9FABA|nr:unnamed protein product [Sphenostylis stenocarpa]
MLNTRNESSTKAMIAKLYECDPHWFTFIEPLFWAVDIFIELSSQLTLYLWWDLHFGYNGLWPSTSSTKMLPQDMQKPAILIGEGVGVRKRVLDTARKANDA